MTEDKDYIRQLESQITSLTNKLEENDTELDKSKENEYKYSHCLYSSINMVVGKIHLIRTHKKFRKEKMESLGIDALETNYHDIRISCLTQQTATLLRMFVEGCDGSTICNDSLLKFKFVDIVIFVEKFLDVYNGVAAQGNLFLRTPEMLLAEFNDIKPDIKGICDGE